MANDREQNWLERVLSNVTEGLWKDDKGRELTAEDIEEMRKYAKNPKDYIGKAQAKSLEQHLDYSNQQYAQQIEENRRQREEDERRNDEP